MKNPRFISVGMRNTLSGTATESYRMLSGRSAEQGIKTGDERVFGLGHAFGVDADTTVGVSTLSKVWSHQVKRVPDLVEWCANVGARLVNEAAYNVNDRLDGLGVAVRATTCRTDIFAVEWNENTFEETVDVWLPEGSQGRLALMEPVVTCSDVAFVDFCLATSAGLLSFRYRPVAANQQYFEGLDEMSQSASVTVDDETFKLVDYLNSTPPRFHAASGGYLEGGQWLAPRVGEQLVFPPERFHVWDWNGVDIRKEAKPWDNPSLINVQQRVENELSGTLVAEFIFNDNGSGELADIVVMEQKGSTVHLTLYHCKYSSEDTPGARVADLYELCGQGLRSARRRTSRAVVDHLRRRLPGGRMIRGDLSVLETVAAVTTPWRFHVVLVQPGVSKSSVSKEMTEIIAATDAYLVGQGFEPMRMVCST